MARYFCRLFSLAHLFLFGKNISQTQDINPELGTLGHILVTAIIFSVSGKKIMAAKIINGQIKRRRLFWADLSCSHFLVALFLRWPKN